MAHENRLPAKLVNQLLSRLVEVKLIRETYIEGKDERTYVPAKDINTITVGSIIDSIDKQGTELFLRNPTPERTQFWARYNNLRQSAESLNLPIKDFLAEPIED